MKDPQPAAALEQPDPFQHLSPEPWHEPQNSMLPKTAIQRSTQLVGSAVGSTVSSEVGSTVIKKVGATRKRTETSRGHRQLDALD